MAKRKWEPNSVELDIAVGWFLGTEVVADDDERELFYRIANWLKEQREETRTREIAQETGRPVKDVRRRLARIKQIAPQAFN